MDSADRGNGSTIIGENSKLQWWMEHAKQGSVRTIPIHANNVSHQNRAFLNGYSFDLGTGFVDSAVIVTLSCLKVAVAVSSPPLALVSFCDVW